MKQVLKETYRLMEATPVDLHPQNTLGEFTPLTKGNYPVFNKFPKFIVDYQVDTCALNIFLYLFFLVCGVYGVALREVEKVAILILFVTYRRKKRLKVLLSLACIFISDQFYILSLFSGSHTIFTLDFVHVFFPFFIIDDS